MRAFVPLLSVCLLGSMCPCDADLHAKWSSFKAEHGKSYGPGAEAARLQAFSANLRLIDEHNARHARGEESYHLGVNAFSDMTPDEIRATKFGAVIDHAARAALNASEHVMTPGASYYDWRTTAATPVKNQASCGSCYSFAAVALVEEHLKKNGRGEFDLSEQQVVDCSYGKYAQRLNFGCNGGDPSITITHALQNAMAKEAVYAYSSGTSRKHGACKSVSDTVKVGMQMVRVGRFSEIALANALANGPVAVTLNGENAQFYSYKGGIYDYWLCSFITNHAVLLVGSGVENGVEYWIIKNSWGPTWGENGYMRLRKGVNRCGIVTADSFYLK